MGLIQKLRDMYEARTLARAIAAGVAAVPVVSAAQAAADAFFGTNIITNAQAQSGTFNEIFIPEGYALTPVKDGDEVTWEVPVYAGQEIADENVKCEADVLVGGRVYRPENEDKRFKVRFVRNAPDSSYGRCIVTGKAYAQDMGVREEETPLALELRLYDSSRERTAWNNAQKSFQGDTGTTFQYDLPDASPRDLQSGPFLRLGPLYSLERRMMNKGFDALGVAGEAGYTQEVAPGFALFAAAGTGYDQNRQRRERTETTTRQSRTRLPCTGCQDSDIRSVNERTDRTTGGNAVFTELGRVVAGINPSVPLDANGEARVDLRAYGGIAAVRRTQTGYEKLSGSKVVDILRQEADGRVVWIDGSQFAQPSVTTRSRRNGIDGSALVGVGAGYSWQVGSDDDRMGVDVEYDRRLRDERDEARLLLEYRF